MLQEQVFNRISETKHWKFYEIKVQELKLNSRLSTGSAIVQEDERVHRFALVRNPVIHAAVKDNKEMQLKYYSATSNILLSLYDTYFYITLKDTSRQYEG